MQNAVPASNFPFLAILCSFHATGFRFRQGKSMGVFDSHRFGARHIHLLVDDPLKTGRSVMFEKAQENILEGVQYVFFGNF